MISGLGVKKLKLTAKGCGLAVVIMNFVSTCCLPGVYFLSCPEPNHAGLADGRIRYEVLLCSAQCTNGKKENIILLT